MASRALCFILLCAVFIQASNCHSSLEDETVTALERREGSLLLKAIKVLKKLLPVWHYLAHLLKRVIYEKPKPPGLPVFKISNLVKWALYLVPLLLLPNILKGLPNLLSPIFNYISRLFSSARLPPISSLPLNNFGSRPLNTISSSLPLVSSSTIPLPNGGSISSFSSSSSSVI